MKEIVATQGAPKAVGPYSQAVVTQGFVYCSGQISQDPVSGAIRDGSIAEQTRNVLTNLEAVLKAAGSDLEHVVKCNVYLTDADTFDEMNQVYAEVFHKDFPARLTVEVTKIYGGLGVEIDAVAELIHY